MLPINEMRDLESEVFFSCIDLRYLSIDSY